jgi:ABC-2 type transport system permease protein
LILPIVRTAMISLRRDGGAFALSFVLPVAFFSIFAMIFGGRHDTTPKITLLIADLDHSKASEQLIRGLGQESLIVKTRPDAVNNVQQPEYTAATAEAAVKAGDAPVALVIPKGYGQNPIAFGPDRPQAIQMLKDSSDMVAPQVVAGLLQKVAMTSMPDVMAAQGEKYLEQYAGQFTPEQRKRMDAGLAQLRDREAQREANPASAGPADASMPVQVSTRDVVGENKNGNLVSFYAAAIGVMFLLFTASAAGGSLLDEAESGALDRVLSSRVTMGSLLAGKLCYCTLLAFAQLIVMFVWAWIVFKVDLPSHLTGFTVMGLTTAFSVAAFGILLASVSRTRAQLGSVSTLLILMMSSIGGSMFPRYFMSEGMQKAGLFTINAWAIDGFTKVFWRDQPIVALWPQVAVLVAVGIVLFAIARRLARRWEFS